jgi:hypothetical protein
VANICILLYRPWGVLSIFASNRHQSQGKKLWSNLGSLKCNQDLNHALGISSKEKEKEKEKEMSTRFIK